ncbi:MAG: hypothetical protein ACKVW3_08450 [Phycisphaerales bacterium]
MSTIHGRAQVGSDGIIKISVPGTSAGRNVEYTITVDDAKANGGSERAWRDASEWREFMRRAMGTIDDPAFERPPQARGESRDAIE